MGAGYAENVTGFFTGEPLDVTKYENLLLNRRKGGHRTFEKRPHLSTFGGGLGRRKGQGGRDPMSCPAVVVG